MPAIRLRLRTAGHGAIAPSTASASSGEEIGAYAIINRGWERADDVDDLNSLANCNNIDHLYEDVVCEEFLEPLERYYSQIMQKHGGMYYFIIHGCGNDARNNSSPNLSAILGYGDGNKPSLTCTNEMRRCFHDILVQDKLWNVWHAGPGSKFSGWDKRNLNQFWRKHQHDIDVQGFQLEFVTALRKTEGDAEVSGRYLASVVERLTNSTWNDFDVSKIKVYP